MTQLDMLAVNDLVREIARALVDEPDAVQVESESREENTVLRLKVAPGDVGKVIGKQGRTARSVRTILGAVSMKLHQPIHFRHSRRRGLGACPLGKTVTSV